MSCLDNQIEILIDFVNFVLYCCRTGLNVITPLASPIDISRSDTQTNDNSSINASNNFFFGGNLLNPQLSWKVNWRNKT